MTFINLDSGGKVTAEWGVGKRKQGKQQKTHNSPLLKAVAVTEHFMTHLLPCSPPTVSGTHLPITDPPHPQHGLHVLTTETITDLMPSPDTAMSSCPFSSFAQMTCPHLPRGRGSWAPSQSLIPDPGAFAAGSARRCQIQGKLHSADGNKVWA